MHDEQKERGAAQAELRNRLADGLARSRLSKTQLAAQAGLSRTTVQLAFQPNAPAPPSAETITALARVLRIPVGDLQDLRRIATAETSPVRGIGEGPGKPISEWNPHDLEVHPAGPALAGSTTAGLLGRVLPGYVAREHDRALACAVADAGQGHSRMVVLVGPSSTGKTRACWEAVQPLAELGWRLWHPYDPTRAQAALDALQRVKPCTVVWLNEAQHYLGDARTGEQISAAVHCLLTDSTRGPVLVLGTLWPEYADQYTALPSPGKPDPHSRVRELLAGRTLTVPDAFDQEALLEAVTLAEGGDQLLADALTRTGSEGRVTQDLAGAPELLRRYEYATPTARAVLEAAMDARRLGVGLEIPQAFLTDAAIDYLSDQEYEQLNEDWAEAAFADLARPVHGKQAPLRRTSARPQRRPPGSLTSVTAPLPAVGPLFRLADYLEQHGRGLRRGKCPPASFWHAANTHLSRPDDLNNLAEAAQRRHRLQWAHHLRGRAADAGDPTALVILGRTRKKRGDRDGAEALYWRAAEVDGPYALVELAIMRREVGDREGAEALALQAADAGSVYALNVLAEIRAEAGNREGAESCARQAANADAPASLIMLARAREEAGDRDGAEALVQPLADAGRPMALVELARARAKVGDWDGAIALVQPFADAGVALAVYALAQLREDTGDHGSAERLYRQAADAGNALAVYALAGIRAEVGDWEGAEALIRSLADANESLAVYARAQWREDAGDEEGAEALYRQVADAGQRWGNGFDDRWPHGLDPDGTPTSPWQ